MTTTFIHGFTQSSASWNPVLEHSTVTDVNCLDAPGHGDAEPVDDTLWCVADRLAEHMTPGSLVGYSMGGRMALHIALAHPPLVERLVLISATPGLRSEEEREARRHHDDELASRVAEIGVERFIDEWMSGPMFASYSPTEVDRATRLANTVRGLTSSLRHQGTGSQDDLWDRLGEIRVPVLLITGELDTKFTDIARRMNTGFSNSRHVCVPGAGHAVHLEQPVVVAGLIDDFVSTTSPG